MNSYLSDQHLDLNRRVSSTLLLLMFSKMQTLIMLQAGVRVLRALPLNQHKLASAAHSYPKGWKLVAKDLPITKTFLAVCRSNSVQVRSTNLIAYYATTQMPRKCHAKSSLLPESFLVGLVLSLGHQSLCCQAHSWLRSNLFIMSVSGTRSRR